VDIKLGIIWEWRTPYSHSDCLQRGWGWYNRGFLDSNADIERLERLLTDRLAPDPILTDNIQDLDLELLFGGLIDDLDDDLGLLELFF
jgi:hypothetical protein